MKYAIVNKDRTGPAWGIGKTAEEAWTDANTWAKHEPDTVDCVQISDESYDEITAGYPEAWVEDVA